MYFKLLIAGPRSAKDHKYSCVCLHSDRNPQERRGNLDRFKVVYKPSMNFVSRKNAEETIFCNHVNILFILKRKEFSVPQHGTQTCTTRNANRTHSHTHLHKHDQACAYLMQADL